MKKLIIISISLTVVFLINHGFQLITDAGIFHKLSYQELNCHKIEGLIGPEDIVNVDEHIFISSTRLPYRYNFEIGDIYYLNANAPKNGAVSLAKEFNISPHGIHAMRIHGNIYVWAIHHAFPRDSVFIFKFENEKLTLVKKIESPFYINSNDILPLDLNTFYLTHDHGSLNSISKKLENYTRQGQGYITLYKDAQVNKVMNGLSFTNGIQRIKKTLFVAQMLERKITSFDIQSDGNLLKVKEFKLNFLPDNITIKDSSTLIVASHPKIFKLQAHAHSSHHISPSSISELNVNNGKETQVLLNDGNLISAASVALKIDSFLYIGNIYQNHILRCEYAQ